LALVDAVSIALIASASIILIGFLANLFFDKTGLPDMLVLILLGVIFGPILGVFDPTAIKSFAPYIAALALAYILFDGGMGLNIKRVIGSSPRAILLAVLGFLLSMLGVAAFSIVAFQVSLTYGLLFGSIFGGSSSVAVISLASKIKISEKGSLTLILESAITDILCVVVSLALLGVIVTGQADIGAVGLGIASKFMVGALVGVVLGFMWLFVLKKVVALPFSYMLTLGIVLLGYAASEVLGGSGALSALLFGLILGNEKEILNFVSNFFPHSSILGLKKSMMVLSVSEGLKRFEAEIAFVIRAFFFVFLGLIASISSWVFLLAGIALSFILLATRFGAVWLTTAKSPLQPERKIMTSVLTRGLAAAVLATLPAQFGLPNAELFVNLAVVIIISTAIMATVGVMVLSRQKTDLLPPPPPPDA
jgi:cell volume regulation protein A